MRILLIDDSSSTRALLRTLVNSGQQVRHEISEAASGEEALQKVGSGEINLPDLVIMDINMGGMSGYELCREFRQRHGTSSEFVPYIIIVTANEGVDVINQALDCGANDYMPKPVNVKILQVRLRVAERLLNSHANSGPLPKKATGALPAPAPEAPAAAPAPAPAAAPAEAIPPSAREVLIANAIDGCDAPLAILSTSGTPPSFGIEYSNAAMTAMMQYSSEDLSGKSLSELEAWTPEFVSMVQSYIEKGAAVSHIPLWSHTRQAVPVHLSFYPIRELDGSIQTYLVVHHF
jgi:CheY-like chemotaxis protein